jgi:filamentous hemagglutinin
LNALADNIGGATGSMFVGNFTSNVLAGMGGALVGGGAGAATASSVDLYNRNQTNADGQGGTGSQALDWIGEQFASAGRGAANLADQFMGLVNGGAQTPPSDSNPLFDANNGDRMPPTAGAVVTPAVPVCNGPVCAIVPLVATPGYVPTNATISNGSESGGGPTIDAGKQGKHQPGHNNFIPGRSEITAPDPQQLVKDYAGTGQPANNVQKGQPGYRERVDFGSVIGNYVDPVTGEKSPTTNGIIHYSKDGVHIVPGRP